MGVCALTKQIRAILFGVCVSFGLAGVAAATEPATPPTNTPPPGETTGTQAADATKPSEQKPEDKKPGDEVICKRIEATTGSRMGAKKVCRTKAEWDAQARGAKETTDNIQDRGRADNPQGN